MDETSHNEEVLTHFGEIPNSSHTVTGWGRGSSTKQCTGVSRRLRPTPQVPLTPGSSLSPESATASGKSGNVRAEQGFGNNSRICPILQMGTMRR